MMEKMEKVVECPICLDKLTPPVKLCKNEDAAICEKCSTSINRCPSCGEEFYARRNVYLNNMLEVMPVACKNALNGCRQLLFEKDMGDHEKICNFELMKCFVKGCDGADIIYQQFSNHIISKHSGERYIIDLNLGKMNSLAFIDLDSVIIPYRYWIFHENHSNKLFLLKYGIDKKILYISAQCLCKRDKAKKYLFEVSFDQGQSVTFCGGGYCSPYFSIYDEVKKDPNALSFDMSKGFFYEKPLSEISVKFKILKNKFFSKLD